MTPLAIDKGKYLIIQKLFLENGPEEIIDFSNFNEFNPATGNDGDTLVWYPGRPKFLWFLPNELSSIRKYFLLPLCHSEKGTILAEDELAQRFPRHFIKDGERSFQVNGPPKFIGDNFLLTKYTPFLK